MIDTVVAAGAGRKALAPALRAALAGALAGVAAGGCGPGGGGGDAGGGAGVDTVGLRLLPVPAALREGAELFRAHCAECHGEAAVGTGRGPPLAHPFYAPAHHADAAFLLAVQRGVRAHHWRFGDMPPLPLVSRGEATAIVGYVRWLQREAGIGEPVAPRGSAPLSGAGRDGSARP